MILIALSVKADVGRHSASYALGHYDTTLSGWGGFTFFIGLLPSAYTFSAIGMISSMAEEVSDPAVKVPKALSLCVPVGGFAGFFFILPICFTMPPLEDIILAPGGQALPYIFHIVMGSPGGGLALTFLVLMITMFCSISITVAASRCTWAFARDEAIPGSKFFSKVNNKLGVPFNALILVTIVQMLLGLINLGSTSAFLAFVSVGVIALSVSYAIPIGISLISNNRSEVSKAKWNCGPVIGPIVNCVALVWIAFEVVLFSMPTVLPVTSITMNYASVVLVGFMTIAAGWYFAYAKGGESYFPLHAFVLASSAVGKNANLVISSLQRTSCFGWPVTERCRFYIHLIALFNRRHSLVYLFATAAPCKCTICFNVVFEREPCFSQSSDRFVGPGREVIHLWPRPAGRKE